MKLQALDFGAEVPGPQNVRNIRANRFEGLPGPQKQVKSWPKHGLKEPKRP